MRTTMRTRIVSIGATLTVAFAFQQVDIVIVEIVKHVDERS